MRVLLDYETDNGRRGLGDVLISTPVIQALAEKYSTRIDVVLRKEAQPLLFNNPYVRNVYETTNSLNHDLHLVLGMKVEHYGNPRNRQPRVDSMAELFGVVCSNKLPQLYYPEQEKIPNSIGVSIESESDVRLWRHDCLLELIRLTNYEWHVFGVNYLIFPDNVYNHLGKLSLHDAIIEVAKMEKFITVDSFFSHLVAALDIPSIIMYTSILAEWRAKYYPNAKTIQSPVSCSPCMDRQNIERDGCDNRCVGGITPQLVLQYL